MFAVASEAFKRRPYASRPFSTLGRSDIEVRFQSRAVHESEQDETCIRAELATA